MYLVHHSTVDHFLHNHRHGYSALVYFLSPWLFRFTLEKRVFSKNLSLPSAKQCRDHQRSSLARRAFTQWSDCLLNANHHRRNRVHFCQGTLQAWLDPFKNSKRAMWCRWCLPSWYLEISPLGWERPSRNSPIVFSLIILEALSQFIYFTWDLSVFLVCVIWTFSLFMDEIKHCTIFCEEKGKEYPNIAKDIALWVYR